MDTEITGTNKEIRTALDDVNLPNLLLVLATVTGDDIWLSAKYQPAPVEAPEGSLFPDDTGRYSEALQEEIKTAAADILAAVRDGKLEIAGPPDQDRLQKMLSFSLAEEVSADYAAMLMEETHLRDRDTQWQPTLANAIEAKRGDDFTALIIGAGMSGIGIAAKLKQAGINFSIVEKNEQVGGTWYENTYPDCGVDTPNHYYSYSFNRNPEWSGYFSKRDELFAYFDNCADEFNIRDHVRFSTEMVEARFNAESNLWDVITRDGQGEHRESVNVVISAVGQLNRPAMPDIPGLDTFKGECWHSARWRDDVDLTGKRVAIVGTGCSCVQLLPKTAAAADQALVFQRTPHWVAPARDYYKPVEPGQLWALKHVPYYAEFHRARMILTFGDRSWDAVVADPNWDQPDLSMNEANHGMREALTEFIKDGLGAKTNYVEHCVPDFPVWGKRLIVDNGWYPTLARDNVDLITNPISAIEAEGIRTEDGELHEVDVLILATGFHSNQFLWPMDIIGKDEQTLASVWGDSANAYKGISVPNFPNLFCLYGPNTNIVHGGSIIYQTECQIHYVMQCLTAMIDKGVDAIDVRSHVNEQYNEKVQAISKTLAWGHPNVESWYKNSDGRVVNNSPFSLQEYWAVTHSVDLADYHLIQSGENEAA
ncbi:MAG: NAD(P)-binding protein [Pseudomonadales bacterium]|nr:NAD(P)-binding protein [Pseudomonadales bacterium]